MILMRTTHRLFFNPAQDMSAIADASVNEIITSPPYPMIEMWDGILASQNATFAEPTPTYMDTSGTTGQNTEEGQNDQTTSSTKTSPKKKIGEPLPDGVKKFKRENGDGSKEFVLSGEDVEQKDPNSQKNKVGHMDLPTSDDNNNQ